MVSDKTKISQCKQENFLLDGYGCICALSLERNLSMHCGILPGSSRMINPMSDNALRPYFVPRTMLEVLYKSLIQSS